MGGAKNCSFISAYFFVSAYFLTAQTYKCMRLISRVSILVHASGLSWKHSYHNEGARIGVLFTFFTLLTIR